MSQDTLKGCCWEFPLHHPADFKTQWIEEDGIKPNQYTIMQMLRFIKKSEYKFLNQKGKIHETDLFFTTSRNQDIKLESSCLTVHIWVSVIEVHQTKLIELCVALCTSTHWAAGVSSQL